MAAVVISRSADTSVAVFVVKAYTGSVPAAVADTASASAADTDTTAVADGGLFRVCSDRCGLPFSPLVPPPRPPCPLLCGLTLIANAWAPLASLSPWSTSI